ncbi:spore cortex biosynthesis protein YabQ [Bacillus sp. JCM 19034]|uniref:spore cortex biosynthesis protein YabQ n=1 Tax=Bacillus sp. JCM 19034 TaxID=1481928 RepID=UPI000783202C|nr:spore cortex biosynthesis protein YabQ [Bacillus sp. JCM 19034]
MSVTVQLYTILSMVGMGLYIGMAIDTYHRLLKSRAVHYWLMVINDVLFWIVQACIVFYVLLHVNNGEVRFAIFLALLCGFAAYQAIFQRIYLKCLEYIVMKLIALYRFIIRLIVALFIHPAKYLLKVLYTLCMMILSAIVACLHGIWKCISWIAKLLFKWTGLANLANKIEELLKKIKGFFRFNKNKDE